MSYTLDPVKPYLPPAQNFARGGSVDDANDQEAGIIPTRPAGPGGDTPDTNPFPTKNGGFGKRVENGAIDEGDSGSNIETALGVIDQAFEYGRKANGLGGQQQASAMPMIPGKQSEYPGPAQPPQPGQKLSALPSEDDTQTFEGGGTVEDEDNSSAEAIPTESGAAGGPPPVTGEETQQQPNIQPSGFGTQGNQLLIRYLRGGDADQNLANQLAQQVDPDGQMDENERNLAVVQAANEQGGPQAAWKVVQANRQAFNAKQAFARAALNGVEGKPPDIAAAAKAATQAFPHMLDGTSVEFTPAQNGVTVAVKKVGQSQPFQKTDLSVNQFNDLLNMGKDGLYDNLLENGIGPVLQQLKGKPGTPVQGAANAAVPMTGATPGAQEQPQKGAQGEPDIDPQMERRAAKLFPNVSQATQRQAWMKSQIEGSQKRSGELGVAQANQAGRIEAARQTGAARVEASKNYAGGRVQAAEVQAGWRNEQTRQSYLNALVRAGGGVLAKKIGNVPFGTELSPEDSAAASAIISAAAGGAASAQGAPAQRAPAPAQGKRPPPGWVKAQ
jgi:hypothetical protein